MNNDSKKEKNQDFLDILSNEIALKVIAFQNSQTQVQEPLKEDKEDIFLNTEEACNFLRITEPTLRKYVRAGRIKKFIRGQRGNFYKKSGLINFLENENK